MLREEHNAGAGLSSGQNPNVGEKLKARAEEILQEVLIRFLPSRGLDGREYFFSVLFEEAISEDEMLAFLRANLAGQN